ncbi:hypothetical protein CJ030_MR2G012886 [Morella rubra]|uniref:Uncharacterized protein n=1 Tax=Morella rubra TaxID=262757 RepID=A0A6A1WEY8_9ROSI|nr:hypothetical protein CJ030_MR2G012886 [Morella rubra]
MAAYLHLPHTPKYTTKWANNDHADCIDLYQQLEHKHPSVSIRRQAAELCYILQAPKLKITQEEMVTIPLIGSSYDRFRFGAPPKVWNLTLSHVVLSE